jgi:phenylacetate-coenzyme A ligase PaaK-like adenylate-forming protein
MLSIFRDRPLRSDAFSDRPLSLFSRPVQEDLANIAAIDLIENGDWAARENWQNQQLTNLLRHAQARSNFWRQRMPSRMLNHDARKYLPVMTREDVARQVGQEGSLATTDGAAPMTYSSTGSTGTPVKVYITPQNGYYNVVRYLAQFFIDRLSLDERRIIIGPPTNLALLEEGAVRTKSSESWAGPLSKVFRNGSDKQIIHVYDDEALLRDLATERAGYLTCHSRIMDIITRRGGLDVIRNLGVKVWFHVSDYRDPEAVDALAGIGVRSLSNYSAGETGAIAFECRERQGYYHVAHSNVIVEMDDQLTATFNGVSVGRLLVTHLHSYASPLIRYDLGDFGQLHERCPCGHDGPTLSNIYGRGKHFLRHPNGSLVPFYLSTRALLGAVPGFTECRVRQNDVETIDVEVGGRDTITADEEHNLTKLMLAATDPAFKVRIKAIKQIDWSGNPKRLLFASAVA